MAHVGQGYKVSVFDDLVATMVTTVNKLYCLLEVCKEFSSALTISKRMVPFKMCEIYDHFIVYTCITYISSQQMKSIQLVFFCIIQDREKF